MAMVERGIGPLGARSSEFLRAPRGEERREEIGGVVVDQVTQVQAAMKRRCAE